MNTEKLRQVLEIPTQSLIEDAMVEFLSKEANRLGARCYVDKFNNVVLKKGVGMLPCVSAHIDSVQPVSRKFRVVRENDLLLGYDERNNRVGFGGDDKAGVYICLELLERFDTIAAAFFSAEEIGCRGAFSIHPSLFDDIGYLVEFDCPARGLVSYTSGGTRLFENDGEFIKRALPVLKKWDFTEWQRHPYSDVMAIRRRFPISCLNLSSGYYNWHAANECVHIPDTSVALAMATSLIATLGTERYLYANGHNDLDESVPPIEIKPLSVPAL